MYPRHSAADADQEYFPNIFPQQTQSNQPNLAQVNPVFRSRWFFLWGLAAAGSATPP
jgi:hypothetical protein